MRNTLPKGCRVIIIAHDIGLSASGLVVKMFVSELIERENEVLVLCQNIEDEMKYNENILSIPLDVGISQLDKVLYILFNTDTRYSKWTKKIVKTQGEKLNQFEANIIVGFGSAQTDLIPKLTNIISNHLSIPYHIHTLDAVPSPKSWGTNKYLRIAIGKSVRRYYLMAKSFSATNPEMLKYLADYHKLPPTQPKEVIYNPVGVTKIDSAVQKGGYFLYLGTLDFRRDARALFKVIKKLEDSNIESNFVFAGTSKDIIASNFKDKVIPRNIKILPFTKEVDELIDGAIGLIDVDIADLGDVYLSSKLIKYLSTNRKIISLTPKYSPAYNLVLQNDLEDIHIVHHDEQELFTTICEVLKNPFPSISQQNRVEFLKTLDIKYLTKKLLNIALQLDDGS
jgi:glycosyltransferase involved in cell wall biosynthesis